MQASVTTKVMGGARWACGAVQQKLYSICIFYRMLRMFISIPEPETGSAARPSWSAFLELGFRPLYMAGAGWALAAVLIWIFAPHWAAGPLGGLAWHAHEMLWGFVATIAVGFLLTAGANWTGITRRWPASRWARCWPCGCWRGSPICCPGRRRFAGRGGGRHAVLRRRRGGHGACGLAFAQPRNYAVPLLMFGLGLADASSWPAWTTGRWRCAASRPGCW